ncbi:MAG: hypothetical protein K6E26_10595 [Clostridiales bacterium]|nr:hypothetical protein [Clostridiales bacterium]
MSGAMKIITSRMDKLLGECRGVYSDMQETTKLAKATVKETQAAILRPIFDNASKNVQDQVLAHLDSGITGLETTIREYERLNASIVKDVEGIMTVTVPSQNGAVSYRVYEDEIWKYGSYEDKKNYMKHDFLAASIMFSSVPKTPQIQECNGKGDLVKSSGRCNVSSVTNLLNRRYAMDTGGSGKNWFTYNDVLSANGCTLKKDWGTIQNGDRAGQLKIEYTGKTGGWASNKTYTNGEVSYVTKSTSRSTIVNEVKNKYSGSYEEYFAAQLKNHPEGVCIRFDETYTENGEVKHRGHVITLTDFSRDKDGNVHLYADDPVNVAKNQSHIDLKKTYGWNKYKWKLDSGIAMTYLEAKK